MVYVAEVWIPPVPRRSSSGVSIGWGPRHLMVYFHISYTMCCTCDGAIYGKSFCKKDLGSVYFFDLRVAHSQIRVPQTGTYDGLVSAILNPVAYTIRPVTWLVDSWMIDSLMVSNCSSTCWKSLLIKTSTTDAIPFGALSGLDMIV